MTVEVVLVEQESPQELAHWRDVLAAFPGLTCHMARSSAELVPLAGNATAILGKAHAISAELVAAAPKLRWIQALTTGIDHLLTIDLPKDVVVTTARGIHGPQMSELAFMYMLGLTRNIRDFLANQAAHRWARRGQVLLVGKRVLIVGIGAISEALALRCRAFGMQVVGISDARAQAEGFDEVHKRAELRAQAALADYVVALVPYSPATHHMISAEVIGAMKPSAIFINIARGNVVDQAALIAALRDRRIAGAGLDVFAEEPLPADSPLWDLENVIITPRIGGMSDIYAQQLQPLVEENMRCFLAGRLEAMRNIA